MTDHIPAEAIEAAARALAMLGPDEEWPSNEALGGGLAGTRDDEYRDSKRNEARDALTAALPFLRLMPSREQLIDLLRSAEHAPMSTHDPRDGSCRECPWPVHMLPPEDIADAVLTLLEGKNDE